jgi:hypothetical protein
MIGLALLNDSRRDGLAPWETMGTSTEMVDTYYAGETSISKQAYPCVVNNRFVQAFQNTGAGSSQFVISPSMGVSDIVLALTMAAGTYTGLSLSQGWGYMLVNRLSVRYGSSAQYFWSGQQMFLQNLIDAENTTKANAIAEIGGNAVQDVSGVGIAGASAYLYLKLPHNSCRASGKPLPFPSDLLVQPIVITIEMLAANSALIKTLTAGVSAASAPASLANAEIQVKQEMLTDSSDLLSRRVDMNSNAYCFPLQYFCQQEVQIPVPSNTNSIVKNVVNLTGFRAGEVKAIALWLQPTDANQNTPASGNYNTLQWSLMNNVILNYNGEVFARFNAGSSQLWNLTTDEKAQSYDNKYFATGAAVVAATTAKSYWTVCPFAQVSLPTERDSTLVHGKPKRWACAAAA